MTKLDKKGGKSGNMQNGIVCSANMTALSFSLGCNRILLEKKERKKSIFLKKENPFEKII